MTLWYEGLEARHASEGGDPLPSILGVPGPCERELAGPLSFSGSPPHDRGKPTRAVCSCAPRPHPVTMSHATTPGAPSGGAAAPADLGDEIRCACCGQGVPRREAKACASCRQPICAACTGWYGHFMLVCRDCRLEPW